MYRDTGLDNTVIITAWIKKLVIQTRIYWETCTLTLAWGEQKCIVFLKQIESQVHFCELYIMYAIIVSFSYRS